MHPKTWLERGHDMEPTADGVRHASLKGIQPHIRCTATAAFWADRRAPKGPYVVPPEVLEERRQREALCQAEKAAKAAQELAEAAGYAAGLSLDDEIAELLEAWNASRNAAIARAVRKLRRPIPRLQAQAAAVIAPVVERLEAGLFEHDARWDLIISTHASELEKALASYWVGNRERGSAKPMTRPVLQATHDAIFKLLVPLDQIPQDRAFPLDKGVHNFLLWLEEEGESQELREFARFYRVEKVLPAKPRKTLPNPWERFRRALVPQGLEEHVRPTYESLGLELIEASWDGDSVFDATAREPAIELGGAPTDRSISVDLDIGLLGHDGEVEIPTAW